MMIVKLTRLAIGTPETAVDVVMICLFSHGVPTRKTGYLKIAGSPKEQGRLPPSQLRSAMPSLCYFKIDL